MKDISHSISPELLAAYIDGNATSEESRKVIEAMENDADIREMMRISQAIDDELDLCAADSTYRPMTAMAASCGDENYCCLECEKFILERHGIHVNEQELLTTALKNKWQEEKGTSLFNIGRHLENNGLNIERKLNSELADIIRALNDGLDVIVVVDGGELIGDREKEHLEDIFIGPIPDHSVVVISYADDIITIYDPDSPNPEDSYPVAQFLDAWADSKYYMVIGKK